TAAIDGFLVAGGAAVWLLALGADIAAFRLRTAVEALAPATIVFIFTSILGIDSYRLLATAGVIACSIVFTLMLRITHPTTPSVPIAATRDRQPGALLKVGLGISVAALAVGLVFGPMLPGVDAAPVIDWKDLDGPSSGPRVTLSPLVDARGRLVQQSSQELFRVRADQPAYWRISGLDRFNGAVWGSDRSYSDAGGRLRPTEEGERTLTQEITITGLSSIWMPAAFEPTRFRGNGIIWDSESATLVVQRGQDVEVGTTYTVESSLNVPTRQQLLDASPVVPVDVAETYTALPPDFSTDVRLTAERITANASTTYEKALALQNHFLDNFVYSLDVAAGHDANRMEAFLFDEQRGYCEQFAGTFAAMARSIGLPTRVAVGFTPGEFVNGEYIVRGEHYHAWPEVWIDGQWIYFEPTPGRGAPRSEQYTNVPQQQAVSGDPDADPLEGLEGLTPGAQSDAPVIEELPTTDNPGIIDDFTQQEPGGRVAPWVIKVLIGLGVVLVLAAGYVLGMPLLLAARRRRRRERAGDDARAALSASWADLTESLCVAGIPRRADETHHEFAARAAQRGHLDHERMLTIAGSVDAARYAADPPDHGLVETTRVLVSDIEQQLDTGVSWQERLKRRADPRVLVDSNR
ncbi:MAG: DUF3488 and transglutaminase-like domain-containing protein, partial [Actinomycetota bacterium]|nr:DUF3488 and transglutaminase-like domain-containing protein [Actinomycetota bacterium]